MHAVSRQGSGTVKMLPKSQKHTRKKEETGREWRKCDEQTHLLWEVWDLETMKG